MMQPAPYFFLLPLNSARMRYPRPHRSCAHHRVPDVTLTSGFTDEQSFIDACAASVFATQHAVNQLSEVRAKLDADAQEARNAHAARAREIQLETQQYQTFLAEESRATRVTPDTIAADHAALCTSETRAQASRWVARRAQRLQRRLVARTTCLNAAQNNAPNSARCARLNKQHERLERQTQALISEQALISDPHSAHHLHITSSEGGRHTPLRLHGTTLYSPEGKQFPLADCSYRHNPIEDTGSSITLIGYGDYERLRALCPEAIRRVPPLYSSTKSVAGVGSVNAVLFHVEFTLVLGGLRVSFHDVPVLAGFSGILLGNDLNSQGSADISFEPNNGTNDGVVTFRDDNLDPISEPIPFTHRHPQSPSSSFSAVDASPDSSTALPEDVQHHLESCVPIAFAPESSVVPAWSEKFIKCRIPAASVEGHTLAILPLDDDRISSAGVLVCPSLVMPKDGYVWVKVINPSTRPCQHTSSSTSCTIHRRPCDWWY